MWLSLEFHYVSKATPNDMASQVKVDGSMTETFPSTQEGNKAVNAWDAKETSKSELHYTSKNIEIYLKISIISPDYYHVPTMIQILCLILEIYFNETPPPSLQCGLCFNLRTKVGIKLLIQFL